MRALWLGLVLAATPLMAGADGSSSEDPTTRVICGGHAASTGTAEQTPPPVMLPGYGSGGFPISHKVAAAQDWFNEGMRLAHAFAHKPAVRAFHEAVRLDPDCAMCVWGEAWARGPNINFGLDDKERKSVAALAARAVELSRNGPELERKLSGALVLRYGSNKASAADKAFAAAMDQLTRARPGDSEIAVIAADAWLIAYVNDNDRSQLNRSIEILEPVLQRSPDDTGAIHFYIHATEIAGVAEKALPYARRLGALAPGASHLVHMPSHTFYRVGLYQDAAAVNDTASAIDIRTAKARGFKEPIFRLTYHTHNVHFGLGGAMMAGDRVRALDFADQFRSHFDEVEADSSWDQMSTASAFYAYGRYLDPQAVLALRDPGSRLPYMRAMWRYARGEAMARMGKPGGVRDEARAMDEISLASMTGDHALPRRLVMIARNVLLGRAAMLEGRPDEAVAAFNRAAALQVKLAEDVDPPLWWYPVRRSVAAAQLAAGHYAQALASAEAALKDFPGDALSLTVAARADVALGHGADAADAIARARKVWPDDPGAVPLTAI